MKLWENISAEALQVLSAEQAWHYQVIPYQVDGGKLCLFSKKNAPPSLQEELEILLGRAIELVPLDTEELQRSIGKYYRKVNLERGQVRTVDSGDRNFLNQLIQEAQQLGGSDIHLEAFEHAARVRIRIDGVLIEKYKLEKTAYPGLINQIKIKANLDISEKRLPQDGRIFVGQGSDRLDIRVSSLPTLHGEKIVMRLLAQNAEALSISSLGFGEQELEYYLESIRRPNGIVLISGPTGSGKTTTLYATLRILNETRRNIITIEDPIEYTLEGINQVQLKEAIGLDFASAMRTFLRQDPDAIMVGEIRDLDTASMAIRASLTGHLVLSTIHTNYAWGIISRLLDMGVPAYLLADTLNAAVAQRLVRLLCTDCKEEAPFTNDLLPRRFLTNEIPTVHYLAKGCEKCFYTGYKGRKAIYEVIPIDRELSQLIRDKNLDTQDVLKNKGIISLAENAFALLKRGDTSLQEIAPLLS
jgi:general secretion pathway protein E/type IV pilus assembly protein PilB